MNLVTTKTAKAGTNILVNGTVYAINENCTIESIEGDDADKLLSIPSWHDEEDASAKPAKADRSTATAQLIDGGGNVVEGQTSEGDDKPKKVEDPPIPEEGEDWADPSEEYSKKWLQACADAYDLKYKSKDSRVTLVEKIKEAMYD